MKKCLLLMVLLLFFTGIQAQTRPDTLKQSKDYLNGKLTYLLLQQFVKDSVKYKDALGSINGDLQNISVNNPPSYAALSSLLKGKFDKVLIKFSEPVDKIDVNSFVSQPNDKAATSLTDTVFAVLSKNYRAFDSALQSNKSVLKDSVLFLLNKAHAQPLQPQQPVDNITNDTPPVQPVNLTPVWLLLALLAAAIIAVSLLYNGKLTALEKKVKELTSSKSQAGNASTYTAFNNLSNTESQRKDIARLIDNNEAIKGFQKAINDLQVRLSDLEKQQNKPLAKAGGEPPKNTLQNKLSIEKKPDNETFYMSGPVNNFFPLSVKSLTKENTVYKFIIKGNKGEAEYELHTSGAPVNEIVALRESYIKPACDEENLPGSTVKNIITKQPGVAMLEGDKWIIKTKALIRYE